jgi:hypothetical protein
MDAKLHYKYTYEESYAGGEPKEGKTGISKDAQVG